MKVGDTLKLLDLKRYLKGDTIKDISDKLDIEYRTLQRWISEEKFNDKINFIKLLKYLDITYDEFLYYIENKDKNREDK